MEHLDKQRFLAFVTFYDGNGIIYKKRTKTILKKIGINKIEE